MATNGHSGYPLKWFKDQNAARHDYECAICLEVLCDPEQVQDCGHRFCALCINDILKTGPRCPSCRIEISQTMIFKDHAARTLIEQLEVNCCNEGCSWQGCLSSLLQDHRNSCNFSMLQQVSALEKKHEEDIKELKLEHAEDVRVLREEILMLRTMAAAHAPQVVQQPSPPQEPEPTYTWEIVDFTRKLAQAKSDNDFGGIESEPFFTSHGYKMKLSVYLNEAPRGNAGYMGVYIILMKSDRDADPLWPFTKRLTFILVDQQDDLSQRQNIKATIAPNGQEEFDRPRQRENGGVGKNQFVEHSTLDTRQYIRDHAVHIKIIVDP